MARHSSTGKDGPVVRKDHHIRDRVHPAAGNGTRRRHRQDPGQRPWAMRMAALAWVALLLLATAAAASPGWQWRLSLRPPAGTRAMRLPAAVFVDQERQRYYVADSGNGRLLSFARDGRFLHAFDAGGGLGTPRGLARLADGRWWVLDKATNQLLQIDIKSRSVRRHTVLRDGRPVLPSRLALHRGRLYLLDNRDGAVLELEQGLEVRCAFTPIGGQGAIDFAIAGSTLYTLDRGRPQVTAFALANGQGRTIPLRHPLALPASLAVAQDGSFLVLDRGAGKVAAFSPTGAFRYQMLGRGQGQGRLWFPAVVRLDPWGNMLIVDEGNGRVELYRR